ncbi:ribonuclease N1 [Nocardioides alpinus]|nr:ribonuclease N1 [Nocardioides alpinus]
MFVPADQDGADTSGGATATSSDPSSSPPPYTPSGDQPTTFPSTPPAAADPDSGLPVVRLTDLPPEAALTLELIDDGGPFPEDRDGVTFRNDEELLPDQPVGYYREYTVPTPGSDDRGARRIVAGDDGELYYTGDHYSSFARIERTS